MVLELLSGELLHGEEGETELYDWVNHLKKFYEEEVSWHAELRGMKLVVLWSEGQEDEVMMVALRDQWMKVCRGCQYFDLKMLMVSCQIWKAK